MSQVLSTKELQAFKLTPNQALVTYKSKAPKGQTQTYEGEFSKHVIVEKFESATLRQVALNEIWPIVENLVFHETRAELLKAQFSKDKNPKEINPFSLSLDKVIAHLRSESEQKVGKLSEALIKSWASSEGLEDGLMNHLLSKLGAEPSDEAVVDCAKKTQGAIERIAQLAGASFKGKDAMLDSCLKLLAYAPEGGFKDRLLERVQTLRKVEEEKPDFNEGDFE